jgi:hypothetical protein
MSKLINDLLSYLKAVFLESGRWVLAIFDILGVVLFFQPHLAESFFQNIQIIRTVGGSIFVFSFLIANFALFRKLTPQPLDEQSLLFYPHRTKFSNAVLMKYVGKERAVELMVMLSYQDKTGQLKQIRVDQFFPPSDPQMLYNAGSISSLESGQETYFHILGAEENSEGKVTVLVTFTGAKTGTQVKIKRIFPLVNDNWLIS